MKNKKRINILLSTLFVLVVFVCGYYIVMAATYYWTQTGWTSENPADESACTTAGGSWVNSECVASHANNQSDWESYSEKSDNADISSGTSISITQETNSEEHTSVDDFSDPGVDATGVTVTTGGAGTSGRLGLDLPS